MESLAGELGVHRNALSEAVNRYGGTIFRRCLAACRVAEMERLACLPENRGRSLELLAAQAGFSNRNSFYRAYKSIRGITPAQWRQTEQQQKR